MEINLLSRKEIKTEIKNIINDAILIKGTVAFWTWNPQYIENNFGTAFFKVLNNPESFFCIDISTPITKIDNISNCSIQANNFFVFSYKFKNIKGVPLLHSKITYIECKDSHNIFLGSHNNTEKAFGGINFEHSVHIKISKKLNHEERIFLDKILFELEKIKTLCVKFNQIDIDNYKNLYKKTIKIHLRFNSQLISNIQKNASISIIHLDLFDVKKTEYENIYKKDVLIFLWDNQNILKKYYLAEGVADDEVEKNEMDEKVTTSDFIALKLVSTSDIQGIKYPFYQYEDKVIKGNTLNFAKHMIQRVKIISELANDDILSIDEINKFQNIYKEIDFEDLELLGINEFEKNNILKIDKEKYSTKDGGNFEQIKSKNINEIFISNTTPDIEFKMYSKLDKIFSFLFNSENSFELSKNKTSQLNSILQILTEDIPNKLNYLDREGSPEEYTKTLKDLALNFINSNLIDKNEKNKLGQFKADFLVKK